MVGAATRVMETGVGRWVDYGQTSSYMMMVTTIVIMVMMMVMAMMGMRLMRVTIVE